MGARSRQGLLGTESDDDAFSEGYFAPHNFMEAQRELERQQEEERRRKAFYEDLAAQIEGSRKSNQALPPDVASLMERRNAEATGLEEEPVRTAPEEITPGTSRRAILGSAMRSRYLEPLKEFGLLKEGEGEDGGAIGKTGQLLTEYVRIHGKYPTPAEWDDYLKKRGYAETLGQHPPELGGVKAEEARKEAKAKLEEEEKIAPRIARKKAEQEAIGKLEGELKSPQGRATIESDVSQLERSIKAAHNMLKHPGLPGAVGLKGPGFLWGLKEKPFAGTPEAGFMALFDQLGGEAFLQSRERLKGGGTITDYEGDQARSALMEINTATNEDEFREGLENFANVLEEAVVRNREKMKTIGMTPKGKGKMESPEDRMKRLGL